jgi:predicted acetyltransferase
MRHSPTEDLEDFYNEPEQTKTLMVIEDIKPNPQYGGRTLVEKTTAYRLSNGELIEDKETAVKEQKELDIRLKIDALIDEYLSPYTAKRLTDDGGILEIKEEAVSLWAVKQFLYSYKSWLKKIE